MILWKMEENFYKLFLFLCTLRILNEDNDITIFSLIGRKDLMAESM